MRGRVVNNSATHRNSSGIAAGFSSPISVLSRGRGVSTPEPERMGAYAAGAISAGGGSSVNAGVDVAGEDVSRVESDSSRVSNVNFSAPHISRRRNF